MNNNLNYSEIKPDNNKHNNYWRKSITLLNLLAFLLLSIIIIKSIFQPFIPWDSWIYHLPFSSYLLDIGGGEEKFILDPHLYERFKGFPLFSEWVQGILWKLAGLNSIALINSLILALFIIYVGKQFKLPMRNLSFGLLAVPLIFIHAFSSYIDLFVALMLCFQIISSTVLLREICNKAQFSLRCNRYYLPLLVYAISTTAAGNTKFMTWALTLAISGIFIGAIYIKKRHKASIVLLIILPVIIISSYTVIKNAVNYDNPFYPVAISIPSIGINFSGPEQQYRQNPDYTEAVGIMQKPINFLLSVTELDWQIRGVEQYYNLDSNTGLKPKYYSPARTGGYWGGFMVLNIGVFIFLFYKIKRHKTPLEYHEQYLLLGFIVMSIITTLMPQSHELRYYLYWPMMLIVNNIYFINKLYNSYIHQSLVSFALLLIFIYMILFLPGSQLSLKFLPFADYSPEAIRANLNKKNLAILKTKGRLCFYDNTPYAFKYSVALIGGNHVIKHTINHTNNASLNRVDTCD